MSDTRRLRNEVIEINEMLLEVERKTEALNEAIAGLDDITGYGPDFLALENRKASLEHDLFEAENELRFSTYLDATSGGRR